MEQIDSIRESSIQSSRQNQQESTYFIPNTGQVGQNGGTGAASKQQQQKVDRSRFSQLTSQNSGQMQQKKYSDSSRYLSKHKYSSSRNQFQGSTEFDTEKGEKVYTAGKHIKIRCKLKTIVRELTTRRFKCMTDKQFITLNDRSIYIQPKQVSLTFREKITKCLEQVDKIFVSLCCFKTFHPYNKVNFLSQICESFMIIFCLFYYSLFCFYDYFAPDLFVYIGTSSLFIFTMGTYLRMNTGYFDQGQIIYDRAKIFKKYRTEVMFYDLIGFIGQIYQLYTNNNNQLTKILCFLLILKYKVYLLNIDKIEDRLNFTGNMVYLWQLIRLMCTSLALCHFVGVAYYFVAFCESYYLKEPNTWVDKLNLWDQSPAHKYIESYYWALATMTLIGTKGETIIETLFCIVVLINTIGIFATILSRVAMVHDEMEKKVLVYKKDRDVLTSFFELHNTPRYLQGQLHNYLKYSFQGHKEKKANQDFQSLMDEFPDTLQNVVQEERYSEKIKKFSLLTKTFTPKTIRQLINYITEEYFMPGQVIIKKGLYEEPKIYLILTGEAEAYSETDGKRDSVLHSLTEGHFFGENTFFTNGVPFYSVKSKEDSFMTCISIKRSDFLSIISQSGSEQDKEKFYAIKDQIKFQRYSYALQTECYICGKKQHFEENCNMLFYQPNKILLSAKYNYSIQQERAKHVRSDQRSGSALFDHLLIFDRTEKIIETSGLIPYVLSIQTHQQMLEEQLTLYSDSGLSGDDDYDVYDIHNSVDSPQLKPGYSQYQSYQTRQGTQINIHDSGNNLLSQLQPNSALSPRNQINNIKISEVSNESHQVLEKPLPIKKQTKTIEFEVENSGQSRLDETHDFNEIDEYSKGDPIKNNQKEFQQKNQQKWLFMEKYSAKSQKINSSLDILNNSRMNVSISKQQKANGLGFGLNNPNAFRRKSNLFNMHNSKQNTTHLLHQQLQKQQLLQQQSQQNRKSRKQSTFLTPMYSLQQARRGTNNQSALMNRLQRKSFVYQQCMNNVHDPFQQMIIQQILDLSTQFNDFYQTYQAKMNGDNSYVQEGLGKEEFFIELDKMVQFSMYFVHNNYDQVIIAMDPNKQKKKIFSKKSKQKDLMPGFVKNQLKQSQASLSRSKYEA